MKTINIVQGFRVVLTTSITLSNKEAEEFKKQTGYPNISEQYLEKTKQDLTKLLGITLPENCECQISNFNMVYDIVDVPDEEKQTEKT